MALTCAAFAPVLEGLKALVERHAGADAPAKGNLATTERDIA
jgi:hypothetical protein